MKEDRQLAGDRYHCLLLALLAALRQPAAGCRRYAGQAQAPTSQIAVSAESAHDVLASLDERLADKCVAGLRDVHLRVALARLLSTRHQPEVGRNVAARGETGWILNCEDVDQGGNRPYSVDLLQDRCFGVALEHGLDFPVISLDGRCQARALVNERRDSCVEGGGNEG